MSRKEELNDKIILNRKFSILPNRIFFIKHTNSNSTDCILLDTGLDDSDLEAIESSIISNNLNLLAIIITHCHIDHVKNLQFLKKKYKDVKIIIHENAKQHLKKGEQHMIGYGFYGKIIQCMYQCIGKWENGISPLGFDMDIMDDGGVFKNIDGSDMNDEIKGILEKFNLEVFYTGGHTDGCISVYNKGANEMYIGDLTNTNVNLCCCCFMCCCGSCGGCELTYPFEVNDKQQLYQSFKMIYEKCDDDTKIYLAHHHTWIKRKIILKTFPEVESLLNT